MISMDVLTCALAGVVTSSLAALPSVLILRRVRRLERQHQPNRRLDDDTPVPLPKDDDDPPPVPVAIAPAPSPPKLVVVRDDDAPPPVPVAMVEPAPSLIRMGTPHPEHCDCDVCMLNRRIAMDEAQAQTLGLLEDLRSLRQGLKTLRLTLTDEIDFMSRQIARHIGHET